MASEGLPLPNPLVPINFSSIQTVPESHSWLDSDELSAKIDLEKKLSLPLIDLLDDGASELIGRTCEQWGMFQLINHGIPETLIVKMEEEAQRLFALPASQKIKTLHSSTKWDGYGMARTSMYHEKCMWQEGYAILGSPVDNAKKLWPSDYKRFCDVMEEYQSKMMNLSDRLLRLMFKFLGILEDEELLKLLSDDSVKPHNALRLNSYPPCPDPDQVMGFAPHTDNSILSIVHQALSDGLQIFKDGSGWVPLSPMSGTLIVNVGDFLQILSNGRFPSILHRVMIQEKNMHRMSLAYFYMPPNDLYISPFVKPMSKSPEFPLYRGMFVKEYYTITLANKGKGLSAIKI